MTNISRRAFTISAVALAASLGGTLSARAEEDNLIALGRELDRWGSEGRFSGTLLVSRNGETLLASAQGLADRSTGRANTLDTRFRHGSMSKMMTGVATLQLVAAGKLALNGTLNTWLPDYPNADAHAVTIHQLLTHTAGMGDIFTADAEAGLTGAWSHADYVAAFGEKPLDFAPGTRFEYSNYGYVLLGRIIEIASGQDYSEYVAKHIFAPAGMTATGIGAPSVRDEPLLAIPYTAGMQMQPPSGERKVGVVVRGPGGAPEGPPPVVDPASLEAVPDHLAHRGTSAGGGYSTASDFTRFAEALLGHRLLDAAHTELATTAKAELPAPPGSKSGYCYGFGEMISPSGVRKFGHNGGAPGACGTLSIFPSTGHVVVAFANLDPPLVDAVERPAIAALGLR